MNNEFYTALELLEKERGIPKEYMLERIEAALIRAFKGEFRSDSGSQPDVRVEFDTEKRTVKMFRRMTVVDIVEDQRSTFRATLSRRRYLRANSGAYRLRRQSRSSYRGSGSTSAEC